MEKIEEFFTSVSSDSLLIPSLAGRGTNEDRSIARPPLPSQQTDMISQAQKDKETDVCDQCGDPSRQLVSVPPKPDKGSNLRLEVTFPWLTKFRERCALTLVSPSIEGLDELMGFYLKNVEKDVKCCYMKPNRAAKLKKILHDALLFFYNHYAQLQPVENTFYLEKMSDLLAFYTDMELKASRRGKETAKTVVSRISCSLFLFLEKSKDYILESILKTKLILRGFREICVPLLGKVLADGLGSNSSDLTYVRYILTFKLWKRIARDADHRKKITTLAASRLKVPSQLRDNIRTGLLNGVLPNIPKARKDVTHFFMQAKFDVKEKSKEFLKLERSNGNSLEMMTGSADKVSFFNSNSSLELDANSNETAEKNSVSALIEDIALNIVRSQAISQEMARRPQKKGALEEQLKRKKLQQPPNFIRMGGQNGCASCIKMTKRTKQKAKVCRKDPSEEKKEAPQVDTVELDVVEERSEVTACADSTSRLGDEPVPVRKTLSECDGTVRSNLSAGAMDTKDLEKVRIKVEEVSSPVAPDYQESVPHPATVPRTNVSDWEGNSVPSVAVKREEVAGATETSCRGDSTFVNNPSTENNPNLFTSSTGCNMRSAVESSPLEPPVIRLDDELSDKVHELLCLNEKKSQWRTSENSTSNKITVPCFVREKPCAVSNYIVRRSVLKPTKKLCDTQTYRFGETGYSANLVVKNLLSELFIKGPIKTDGTFLGDKHKGLFNTDCKKSQVSTWEKVGITHSISNILDSQKRPASETQDKTHQDRPRNVSTFLCVCDDKETPHHDSCSDKNNTNKDSQIMSCDNESTEPNIDGNTRERAPEESENAECTLSIDEAREENVLSDMVIDISTVAQEVEVISEPKEEPTFQEDVQVPLEDVPIIQEQEKEPEKVHQVEKKVPSIKIKIVQNTVEVEPEIKKHRHDRHDSTDSSSARKESKRTKSKRKHRDREHRHSKHEKEPVEIVAEAEAPVVNVEEAVMKEDVPEDVVRWLHSETCKLDNAMCKHQFFFREYYSTRSVSSNLPTLYFPHAQVRSSQGKQFPRCHCLQCTENLGILVSNYKSLVKYLHANRIRRNYSHPPDEMDINEWRKFCGDDQQSTDDSRDEKTALRLGINSEQDSSLPLKKRKTMTNVTSEELCPSPSPLDYQQSTSENSMSNSWDTSFNYQTNTSSTSVNLKTEYSSSYYEKYTDPRSSSRQKDNSVVRKSDDGCKKRNSGSEVVRSARKEPQSQQSREIAAAGQGQVSSKDIRDPRVLKRLRWEDQCRLKRKDRY